MRTVRRAISSDSVGLFAVAIHPHRTGMAGDSDEPIFRSVHDSAVIAPARATESRVRTLSSSRNVGDWKSFADSVR
jgi:hypothetical protein